MLGKEKGKQRLIAIRSKGIVFKKHLLYAYLDLTWNKSLMANWLEISKANSVRDLGVGG